MTEALAARNLTLDGVSLTPRALAAAARQEAPGVRLSEAAEERMRAALSLKWSLIEQGIPIYGVTTGFGDSCIRQIGADKAHELQRNLVLFHLNGTGPAAVPEVARATMIIRANSMSRGTSAIRPEVAATLLEHVKRDILPRIPERGSLGASGDLVPLCYLAAALIGEGDVTHRGVVKPALDALLDEGIDPVRLEPKEGLALINGTSYTAGYAVMALWDAREIALAAELATAMTVEALVGNASAFHPFTHRNKPHPGQVASAASIRILLAGSRLATSFEEILIRREVIGDRGYLHPLFDTAGGSLHLGGNFYAGHVGQSMDSLKTATANIADLLDRQLELVVDEKFNQGLPPNLIVARDADDPQAGLHHGFKGMQIAASAITAEALKQTMPSSVFSRSTEAHNQDKVSMGTIAARDARTVNGLVREVAAIHLLALAQAIDLRGAHLASPAVRAVHSLVREVSPFVDRDRRLDRDIAAVISLIESGALRRAAGLSDDDFIAGQELADRHG
jgi:histidine ammonia-lyase/phenylalanine ammonia-lyase